MFFTNFSSFRHNLIRQTRSHSISLEKDLSMNHNSHFLYNLLKDWRKQTAEESRILPFTIFSNSILEQIVYQRPTTLHQLALIRGIGPKKIVNYGEHIIKIVRSSLIRNSEFEAQTNSNVSVDISDVGFSSNFIDLKYWSAIKRKKKPKEQLPQLIAHPQPVEDPQLTQNKNQPFCRNRFSSTSLSKEQLQVSKLVLDGKNVFITGSAGTGKSFLLRFVIQELQNKFGPTAVGVCAPTGVAAINIGGQTIHAFAGIGLAKMSPSELVAQVKGNKKACARWKKTKVLVIDEVSMLSCSLFESLDLIAKGTRGSSLPFGGMQLVLCGDFFQLPPVRTKNEPKKQSLVEDDDRLCFESQIWRDAGLQFESSPSPSQDARRGGTIQLKDVFRQKGDPEFVKILNEIRLGSPSPHSIQTLNQCVVNTKPLPPDHILPTKLFCLNMDVDHQNHESLAELAGNEEIFLAEDSWINPPKSLVAREYLLSMADKVVPRSLSLKVGAQVMLLRNNLGGVNSNNEDLEVAEGTEQTPSRSTKSTVIGTRRVCGLVNGSRGRVLRFSASMLNQVSRPIMWRKWKCN